MCKKKGLIEGLQVDEISRTWVAVSSLRRELAHFLRFLVVFFLQMFSSQLVYSKIKQPKLKYITIKLFVDILKCIILKLFT